MKKEDKEMKKTDKYMKKSNKRYEKKKINDFPPLLLHPNHTL